MGSDAGSDYFIRGDAILGLVVLLKSVEWQLVPPP